MELIRIFNPAQPNRSTAIFNGENSGLLNFDDVANKEVRTLWDTMCSQYWRPEEVTLAQDQACWVSRMSEEEKKTFKTAVGQLAVLDSLATRYDLALSHYITDSVVTAAYSFVAAMESIHNYSYTYILSSFTNQEEKEKTFEEAKTNPLMLKRNRLVIDVYEQFMNNPSPLTAVKSLIANLVLENLFFTSGFSYFFHLARIGKMLGSQTIITMIFKDETLHSKLNSLVIKQALKENPEILGEVSVFAKEFLTTAIKLEKEWSDFLYLRTPAINKTEIKEYIEWRGNMILSDLGLSPVSGIVKNPMPWIKIFDPENRNAIKTDFFEARVDNYSKAEGGGIDRWADL